MTRLMLMAASGALLALAGCGNESSPSSDGGTAPTELVAPSGGASAPSSTDLAGATDAAAGRVDGAADQAEAAARATMSSYLEALESAATRLGAVTDRMSAASAAPEMQAVIGNLGDLRDQLLALPDETLTAIRAEFDAQLSRVEQMVTSQLDRIGANPELAGPLGDLLGNIPMLGAGG